MISLFSDISTITGIPKLTLEKLSDKARVCIADSVLEQVENKESQTSVDIGIGILHIKIEDCNIKYKFVPNKDLDATICRSIKSKESPLIRKLDNSLNEKISSTYKELL